MVNSYVPRRKYMSDGSVVSNLVVQEHFGGYDLARGTLSIGVSRLSRCSSPRSASLFRCNGEGLNTLWNRFDFQFAARCTAVKDLESP